MRQLLAALLAVAALAPAASAPAATVPRPPGPAPLRYRDVAFRHVAVTSAIRYGADPALLLDLYRPRGDRAPRRPAMVWVHGGGFQGGTRTHRTLRSLALGSARRGYVAISVDYRILKPAGCETMEPECRSAAFEDQHDVQAAIRWLRRRADRYRIDPERIAVGGTSMGGVLAYLAGTRADDDPEAAVGAFVSVAGGWPGEGFATPGDAPGLLFHGTHDRVVPLAWSADAARGLRAAGVPVVFERIPRGQHVAHRRYRARYDGQTAYWLYARLRLAAL